MTIKASEPPALKRQFPHVDDIEDWRAQQSIRLLWDRVFDLEARLQAAESNVGGLVSQTNTLEDDLTIVDRKAMEALAVAQLATAAERKAAGEAAEGEGLPNEAPTMLSVLESTLAAPPPAGGTWNLTVIYGPGSQSKFIEAAVNNLHATDARWGHVNKTGGQTGSVGAGGDGHAVDAINWKNPDNVTAEIYDVITSWGALTWDFRERNEDALSRWKYPA